jgi:hypothetical protein
MDIVHDITRFALAVLKNWQAYMTGGIIMAILTSYEWLTKRTISRRVAIVAIVSFFAVASFMAWSEQYQAALRIEAKLRDLTTPEFKGSIDSVSVSPSSEKGDALVIINAHIINLGSPSIAEFSDCMVRTASGRQIVGEFGPIPPQLAVSFSEPKLKGAKAALIYVREDNLLVKGSAAPIPTGGAVSGWLYVVVHGIDENEILRPGTIISLAVDDVRGKALHLSYAMTFANIHKGLPQGLP